MRQDNMDICGPNWTQNSLIYSGRVELPPSSQYIPSVYSSRNGYGQSKRITTETSKQPVFVLRKNGNYTLTLSNDKNMVLSVFKENVYCHIWDNKNKRHVSLHLDELAGILKNNRVVQDIMQQLLMVNVEKKSYFPFVVQKTGTYALVLSEDKKMVLSQFKGKVYCHIWDNKNKKHVSLNSDELMHVLSHEGGME